MGSKSASIITFSLQTLPIIFKDAKTTSMAPISENGGSDMTGAMQGADLGIACELLPGESREGQGKGCRLKGLELSESSRFKGFGGGGG